MSHILFKNINIFKSCVLQYDIREHRADRGCKSNHRVQDIGNLIKILLW